MLWSSYELGVSVNVMIASRASFETKAETAYSLGMQMASLIAIVARCIAHLSAKIGRRES